jgi:phage terminase small subunit
MIEIALDNWLLMKYIRLMSAIIPSKLPRPPKEYSYSQKEADFCIAYAFSNNGTESVKQANYDISSDNSASAMASRLLSVVKISDYISILKQWRLSPKIITRAESLEILSEIARNTYYTGKDGATVTPHPNISAIDTVNKMTGEYAPTKLDVLGKLIFDVEFIEGEPIDANDSAELLE